MVRKTRSPLKPRRRGRRIGIVAGGVVVGLILVANSTALADGQPYAEPTPSAGGWYYFSQDTQLIDPVSQTIVGAPTTGGCTFDSTLSLPVGQTAIDEVETAVNMTTCQAQVQIGEPNAQLLAAENVQSPGDILDVGAPEGAFVDADPAPNVSLPGTEINYAGYFHSWYQDPVGIHVTSVQNNLAWKAWDGRALQLPDRRRHRDI